MRGINKPVLLIIDELPDLILNMRGTHDDELKEFLGWFRRVRQQPSPSKDSIRWLIGGSVNLASTLDEIGEVDLINDIAMEPLPILTDDQVKDFVVRMLRDPENDFYVCECQSDCFDFSSGVIKAWWRKYYG